MPTLAVLIQYKDGTNIVLQTNGVLTFPHAVQLSKEFADRISQIRKEDFGPLGPSFVEPHFASGRFNILSHYNAIYSLLQDVYLVVFQHAKDNPFHSDHILSKIKSSLLSILKSDKPTKDVIQNKYSDILVLIEKSLDGTNMEEKDDWYEKENQILESRLQVDSLINAEFEIPTQWFRDAPTNDTKVRKPKTKKLKRNKKPKLLAPPDLEEIPPPPPPPEDLDFLDIIPPPPPEEDLAIDIGESSMDEPPPPPPDDLPPLDEFDEVFLEFETLTDDSVDSIKDDHEGDAAVDEYDLDDLEDDLSSMSSIDSMETELDENKTQSTV